MEKDTDPRIMTLPDVTEARPDEVSSMEHAADNDALQAARRPKRKVGKKPILFAVSATVIVAAILYFVFFALKPVQNAVSSIDAIGDVSLLSKQHIVDARQAYDALPKYLQNHVSKYSVLTEAEEKYKQLYCLSLVPKVSLDYLGMEVTTSFSNNTLTIVENSTDISYTDVMILGASVVSPMITSTSQDIKSKVDAAGYKDVDVVVEFRVSNIPLATAKNGSASS